MVSVPNTLLIDGHDIRTDFPGMRVFGDMNLYAPGKRRGDDQIIPGMTGQVPVPGLPLDAYTFSVFVIVQGATRGAKEANLRALSTVLVGSAHDGLVTLTRRLANAADTGYDECTAQGRFVSGLSFQVMNPYTGKTELQFVNLTGGWRRTSDNVLTLP
jgi:hypothetical protein